MSKKVAVICGAGRLNGIGAAIAKLLAGHGYALILNTYKNYQSLEKITEECRELGSSMVQTHVGDLSLEENSLSLVDFAKRYFTKVDVLVNSYACKNPLAYTQFEQLSASDFMKFFETNVISHFLTAKFFYPLLSKAEDGVVINISSMAGITGNGSSIPYAVSKGALNTLTKALAQAFSPDVRVNAICPAFVDSSWWEDVYLAQPEKYKTMIENIKSNNLRGAVLKPEQVALAAFSLMVNSAITGEITHLDLGASIGKAKKSSKI